MTGLHHPFELAIHHATLLSYLNMRPTYILQLSSGVEKCDGAVLLRLLLDQGAESHSEVLTAVQVISVQCVSGLPGPAAV